MAQDIFIDLNSGLAVTGPSNPTPAALPAFVQGDTLSLRLWLLQRTTTFPTNPYTLVPVAGLTLQAALGSKVGSGGTVYTQQLTWAPSVDPVNPNYWTATFAMNTAAITTLLGSNATAAAIFEVKTVSGQVPTTILQTAVVVNAGVIQAGGVVVPAGLNAASVEYVNATCLTRAIVGQFTMQNPTTGKLFAVYIGDDGTFHTDALN